MPPVPTLATTLALINGLVVSHVGTKVGTWFVAAAVVGPPHVACAEDRDVDVERDD